MNRQLRQVTRLKTLALACALALATPAATAGDFSGSIFFGDSLTDSGTFGARFTTNPAQVWSELTAQRLGTQASPAIAGGTNYAEGGARVTLLPGVPNSPPTDNATPIATQITNYLGTTGGIASPTALYSVWGGANDVFVATSLGAGAPAYLAQTGDELAAQIARLQAAGARYVVVLNVPDIGTTPFGVSQGPAGAAALTQLSAGFNQALHAGIAARGLRVVAADTFGLLNEVLADPAAYGFVNASAPACGATPSLLCTPADLVAPGAERNFVFADGVHPTAGGHALLDDYMASILAAPGQISMLPETAVQTRGRLVDQLFAQLRLGSPARERNGRNVWIAADGRYAKVDSGGLAGSADGWGGGLSIGADYSPAPGWVLGAALAHGEPKIEYSGGGHFRLSETALSLYGGWEGGAYYVSSALTFGELDYDVRRQIRLGDATRTARGAPGGRAVSLGLEAGARYAFGRITHGPVGGLLLQQVKVDGFAEQGGGSAGMRYGEQTRDSAIGRIGWRLEYDAGPWRPYARLTLDRELRDDGRQIEAQVATSPDVPMFSLPAAEPGRSQVTLAAGTSLQLTGAWTAHFGLAQSFQDAGRSGSAFATLAMRF